MSLLNKAIGGYFGLDIPKGGGFPYNDAYKYQSARAAFYALLLAVKPERVWMPRYICDSMLAPLYKANVEICFYGINKDFSIKENVVLKSKDLLLYVNYFGVCEKVQDELLLKYNSEQLVFDHSQAFFTPPKKCLATIYSPRKFFGVPDGGLLFTEVKIQLPKNQDEASYNRSLHLLKRFADSPESGYSDFQIAEESLKQFEPLRMSKLTEKLLSGIDYKKVKEIRNRNFLHLHNQLKDRNKIVIDSDSIDGPMVYPFLQSDKDLKTHLITNRIFVSTYWPECLGRVGINKDENELIQSLLPLPCDQRYVISDLNTFLKIIKVN